MGAAAIRVLERTFRGDVLFGAVDAVRYAVPVFDIGDHAHPARVAERGRDLDVERETGLLLDRALADLFEFGTRLIRVEAQRFGSREFQVSR